MYVLSWIFFGAFTGWIAGLLVNKRGEGCIVNTALGLVGALVGGGCSALSLAFIMKNTAFSFLLSWR